MKKKILMVGALCGLFLLGGMNLAYAGEQTVKDGMEVYGGYTYLGNLGTVTVDTGSDYVITVPAPKEQVSGTAPSGQWYINGNNQLVVTIRRHVLMLSPGESVNIEVGVRMSNGEIGVYYITLIGK